MSRLSIFKLWAVSFFKHEQIFEIICRVYQITTITNRHLGQDSPSLKLYYLSFWLSFFQWKTLLVEKTVIIEHGESQPRATQKICDILKEFRRRPDWMICTWKTSSIFHISRLLNEICRKLPGALTRGLLLARPIHLRRMSPRNKNVKCCWNL